jgi:hypothetical protein
MAVFERTVRIMSAKTAQDSLDLIIDDPLTCRNFRTVNGSDEPAEGLQTTTLAARFWAKVDRKSPSECWPWLAHVNPCGGYGQFKIDGRTERAHRVAFVLATGQSISGYVVRHWCHNAPCCNPAHLKRGTQQQNVRDAIAARRHCLTNLQYRKHVRNGSMLEARPLSAATTSGS